MDDASNQPPSDNESLDIGMFAKVRTGKTRPPCAQSDREPTRPARPKADPISPMMLLVRTSGLSET